MFLKDEDQVVDEIWFFKLVGNTSGNFSRILGPGGTGHFPQGQRLTSRGVFGSSDTSGYAFGGNISDSTSPNVLHETTSSDLKEFQFDHLRLFNASSTGNSTWSGEEPGGLEILGCCMIHAPRFRTEGVNVLLGNDKFDWSCVIIQDIGLKMVPAKSYRLNP